MALREKGSVLAERDVLELLIPDPVPVENERSAGERP